MSEEQPAKDQGAKEKPCRACSDFKTWMKTQKKQASSVTGQIENKPARHQQPPPSVTMALSSP
ncbi:FAD-linked sulfhydryl oxidase ALR [Clarias magur]|uniref:FAD-linked sulfhydryl oxidase ALR n=1 Tax=Clarias magur TaxID=1594786 RepID=A0A8J4TQ08_CLAMG|nr:FAD-linked sulfhydryl oxidase ALR [Clarias magur]